MAAAYLMGEVCQRMIKPGNTNVQVSEALSTICKAYDVNMLQGILMHQMKRFVIDGNKVILSCNCDTDRVDECTFEPNEVHQGRRQDACHRRPHHGVPSQRRGDVSPEDEGRSQCAVGDRRALPRVPLLEQVAVRRGGDV